MRNKEPIDYAKETIDMIMRKFDAADLPPKGGCHYHQGVLLDGVYRNYMLRPEEEWFQYMKDWVDSMLDQEGRIKGKFSRRLDDIQPGNLLFPIYQRTGEQKYKNTLDELMRLMLEYPKNKEGGFWHTENRKNQMWLDGLYMGGPFICKYAFAFHHPEYYDISATQALLMCDKTRDDKTGLWYHGYDEDRVMPWANQETGLSPEFWGRSIGWVAVAVLEELDYIPKEHPKYEVLCELVKDLLISVCKYQSEDGRWYQVVDKGGQEGNWLENSCSCLYAAGICKAVEKGILDKSWLKYAEKGYEGVIASLTWMGQDIQIGNICIGTPVGDYKHYCERPTSVNDLHGVGAFLIMCAEMQRCQKTMRNHPYNPEKEPFPPHIEESHICLERTELSGGNGICFADGMLYMISAAEGGSLRVCTTDGSKPKQVGELKGLGTTRQIEVGQTADGRRIAAITARDCGLYLVDVSNPEKPYICCHYNTVEFATGVAFCGQHLAIGCRSFGVEIIDISVPENPRHLSVIRAGEVQSVYIDNGILYTGSWVERQINVIDIHDVTAPRKLATIPLEGRGDGLIVRDGILYAAFGQHLRPYSGKDPKEYGYGRGNGFAIWDVSKPDKPKKLSVTLFEHRYYYCTYDFWSVKLSGHYAIVSHTLNGVWIYNVSDFTAPVLVDHIAVVTHAKPSDVLSLHENTLKIHPMFLPFDFHKIMYAPVTGVAVCDDRLYVLVLHENLHVAYGDYFVAELSGVEVEGEVLGDYYLRYSGENCKNVKIVSTNGQVHAAAYYDGKIWVACGMDGIRIYNRELNAVGHYAIKGFAMDIREQGGLLYVAAGKEGILILRPEGDTLCEVGRFDFGGSACAQVVPTENGCFVIAHLGQQHVSIVDVSNPVAPKELIRETDVPGLVYHRQLSHRGSGGNYYGYYLNWNHTHWYDFSGDEPRAMNNKQGMLCFEDGLTGLDEEGKALIVVRGGYIVSDIREASIYEENPLVRVPGVFLRGKPMVSGHTLIVSDRLDGNVVVCDISNLQKPKLLATYNFSGHPDVACLIDDGCAVIPLGHQGIAMIKFGS